MKKLYKVILALAVSMSCASAFAEGAAELTTVISAEEAQAEVAISSYGNTVTIENAEGETVKIYSILGGTVETGVVTDGQVTLDVPTGFYVVVVGGTSQTVYIQQ